MRDMTQGQERGALIVLALLLALAAPFVPFFGVLCLFVWPAPLVVLAVRHGYVWAFLGGALASAVFFVVLGLAGALHAVFLVLPMAFFWGFGLRRKWSAERLVRLGFIVSLGGTGLSLAAVALSFGVDPLMPFLDAVRESYLSVTSAIEAQGNLPPAKVQAMESQVSAMLETVALIAPVIFIAESAMAALLNFSAVTFLLGRLRTETPQLPSFSELRFSVYFLYLFGFSLVGLYWGGTRHIDLLYAASLNGNIIAAFAGLIQGFCLFWYVADRWRIGTFWRWAIVAFAVLSTFLMQLIAFTGLFDMYFDYRRRFMNRR